MRGGHPEGSSAQPPAPRYLTKEEAAQLARCSPSTIMRYVRAGEFPAFRPGGNRVLIREDDLRAWIEEHAAVDPPRPASPPRRPRRSPRRSPSGPGTVEALRRIERDLGA